MFQIEEELKKLPANPGVYLMHDERDEIIYVGKAISLKNRVRQYFQSSRQAFRKNRKQKLLLLLLNFRTDVSFMVKHQICSVHLPHFF